MTPGVWPKQLEGRSCRLLSGQTGSSRLGGGESTFDMFVKDAH